MDIETQREIQVSYWDTCDTFMMLCVEHNLNFLAWTTTCLISIFPKSGGASTTFTSEHEHVDSWVRHVFALQLYTRDTHRGMHTLVARCFLHILRLNQNKLPCSAKHLYNAPIKIHSLHHWHIHLFTFFSPHCLPVFVTQRPLQYMCKTARHTAEKWPSFTASAS